MYIARTTISLYISSLLLAESGYLVGFKSLLSTEEYDIRFECGVSNKGYWANTALRYEENN